MFSRLPHVQHPSVGRSARQNLSRTQDSPATSRQPNDSQTTLVASPSESQGRLPNDSQTTLVTTGAEQSNPTASDNGENSLLRPSLHTTALHGPLSFDVLLFARPYRITIHPSTSPLFIDPFPDSPNLLILTYAIPSRASLHNVQNYWMPQYHQHYPTSSIPVMLLGLQRDLRTAKVITDDEGRKQYECVMPEEGLQAAREMRLDRYAECSALTGELMWEATQDITKMAAQTAYDTGDYASEMCVVT